MSRHACVLLALLLAGLAVGGPITREEGQRRRQVLAKLDAGLADQPTDSAKLELLRQATASEPAPDVRRQILTRAEKLPVKVAEGWLIERLKDEPDCHLRGQVATLLGAKGSTKAVDPLIAAAYSDAKTTGEIGCTQTRGTARRQALFALAALGRRLPKARVRIVAGLDRLPTKDDKTDLESIHDVRLQALYQLTGRADLIQPFLQRLQSADPAERNRGVVAMRFLGPDFRTAPPALIARLKDPDAEVRSCAAGVLGEIGDPASAGALMAAAADKSLQNSTRVNAIVSLKRMKCKTAAPVMERLAKDPNPVVAHLAAVALAEIKCPQSGKREGSQEE